MEPEISYTKPSHADEIFFRQNFELLLTASSHKDIARIYDQIIARLSSLLIPRKQKQAEYFDDQKFVYYAMVRRIMSEPEVQMAMARFKADVEDFFKKKPAFRWK